ncbi:MAG: type I-E CRISPR-associated protein Cas6/Cse3/CasE [Tropicimonas sp.]|uniref:type I-E CRISPR-associated protein Cas6/Cse3/CasE n=1 Tax=Tropicimonas sp. TaxID=2067044 RepID=UPI003A86A125
MNLSLLRTRIDPDALRLFAETSGLADDDLNYALHTALRRRFGAHAPQPFRWPVPKAGPEVLLGYSTDPEALLGGAAVLPNWSVDWSGPAALEQIFRTPFEARPMPAAFAPGTRLAFNLRLRPVRRYGSRLRDLRKAGGGSGAGERDVFLAAIEARDARGSSAEAEPLDRAAVYEEWLSDRLAPSAELESARMVAFHRQRLRRKGAAGGKTVLPRIAGPDVEFEGILRVRDPDAFARLLSKGVGRHRAFGFGMLLLHPPER